jgi:hypothetical protein
MLVLGVLMLALVAVGLGLALRMASRHAAEASPPSSVPSDFVAPVSSGGYAWRATDETDEQFKRRVAQENGKPDASR